MFTHIDRLLHKEEGEDLDEEDAAIVIARPPVEEQLPWTVHGTEGELAVDVYHQGENLVIAAVIGGVSADDIAVEIHGDVVTIRGVRRSDTQITYDCYLTQECYWGPFSRTVVLPSEVSAEAATARFRQGVLSIVLPKISRAPMTAVPIIDESEE